jgi:predicted NUDIX family phosphoesterase
MSRYHGEQVLVVPRSAFEEQGYFQGTQTGADKYINALMQPGIAQFMDREAAEQDPSFKQIIPYGIFRYDGKILHYTRGGSSGEARLHDKGSLGIGGHINPIDNQDHTMGIATYMAGVEREVSEEITINGSFSQKVIGVINDDSNDVGAVHLGVVHLFELSTNDVTSNESALANLQFLSPDELMQPTLYDKLETWSQLALQLLKESHA